MVTFSVHAAADAALGLRRAPCGRGGGGQRGAGTRCDRRHTSPRDPRVRVLNVTPDPGVIEVNIHPAASWDELVATTTTLYEEARQSRLGTEKFMLDGRHTGTGGGNHVTLGGATPADSPLLRRPDLLQSLVTYWQNHPALSYLFSGTFIGPTSQAPRVDEARDDRLYELEIAFQQMNRRTRPARRSAKPWLVDRLLRHLLIDLTGNTHRAEFSIDKLYSPDGPTGRLGLLEFRAFEMPPHARMSAVQMLLLRALVARFWKQPYRARSSAGAPRCTIAGCCRTSSPPISTTSSPSCAAFGYPFEPEWFAPFVEFRFPRFGTVDYGGVTIELRQAIEPWHVLGEEVSGTGTARYVDSSVERLQVKVTGMTGDRHRVACNGRALPLAPTGVPGEYVAGVRFRAWSPPSALHPTIPRPGAARLRPRRHVGRARARRLHLPRRPSGRAQLRHVPGQRQRGRSASPRAVLGARPHAGRDEARRRAAQSGDADHARLALATVRVGARRPVERPSVTRPHPLRPEPDRLPAPGRRPHRAVRVGLRARVTAARSSCASRTPTWSARRPRPCRRSSTRWPGSGSTTTRARSTRCSGWTATARCSPRWSSVDSPTAATCRPRSSRRCAPRRWRAARSRATTAAGAPRTRVGKTPPPGVAPVIRFRNPLDGVVAWDDRVKGRIEIANAELDDLVIARADGTPTYNFCVVVDDIDMRITHVVRGDDHVNNTPRQINIIRALGAEPPVYAHVPTVLGEDGQKLSKRHGAVSVMQYEEMGYLPDAMVNFLARLGWAHGDAEVFGARRVRRLVRPRRDQPGAVALRRRQAEVGEPRAPEAPARGRARPPPRAVPRAGRARSGRAGPRRAPSGCCSATASRRSPRWPTPPTTSTRRRTPIRSWSPSRSATRTASRCRSSKRSCRHCVDPRDARRGA